MSYHKNRSPWLLLGGAILLCAVAKGAVAQVYVAPGLRRSAAEAGTPAGQSSNVVRIRKIVGTGNQGLVKSPEYRTNMPSGTRRAGNWARIATLYDTGPEWTDELVFQYYVMVALKERGGTLYSYFKTVVRYVDIEKGRNHMSEVYIHPGALKRYGDVVAAAVEIVVNGAVLDSASDVDPSVKLPADWWKNPVVLQSKSLTVRDGYLLNRKETPFAFINVDDYEVIK